MQRIVHAAQQQLVNVSHVKVTFYMSLLRN